MQFNRVESDIFHLDDTFSDAECAAAGVKEDQPAEENASASLLVIAESLLFAYNIYLSDTDRCYFQI